MKGRRSRRARARARGEERIERPRAVREPTGLRIEGKGHGIPVSGMFVPLRVPKGSRSTAVGSRVSTPAGSGSPSRRPRGPPGHDAGDEVHQDHAHRMGRGPLGRQLSPGTVKGLARAPDETPISAGPLTSQRRTSSTAVGSPSTLATDGCRIARSSRGEDNDIDLPHREVISKWLTCSSGRLSCHRSGRFRPATARSRAEVPASRCRCHCHRARGSSPRRAGTSTPAVACRSTARMSKMMSGGGTAKTEPIVDVLLPTARRRTPARWTLVHPQPVGTTGARATATAVTVTTRRCSCGWDERPATACTRGVSARSSDDQQHGEPWDRR